MRRSPRPERRAHTRARIRSPPMAARRDHLGRLGGALAAARTVVLLGSSPASGAGAQARYSIVGGCYALGARGGDFAEKGDGGYTLTASAPGKAEPFRLQATDLATYLLYGRDRDFLAAVGGGEVT